MKKSLQNFSNWHVRALLPTTNILIFINDNCNLQNESQAKEERLQQFQDRIKAWEKASAEEEAEEEEEDESAENTDGIVFF